MRLVLAVLLVGASAHAQPGTKPAPKPDTKPEKPTKTIPHVKGMSEAQRGVELTPSIEYQNDTTRAPAFGGGTALGMVQRPPWHNDMREYAEGGMVIRPPATNDNMVIIPGTSWIPGVSRFQRFWNVLQYGIDRGLEKLVPSAGGT